MVHSLPRGHLEYITGRSGSILELNGKQTSWVLFYCLSLTTSPSVLSLDSVRKCSKAQYVIYLDILYLIYIRAITTTRWSMITKTYTIDVLDFTFGQNGVCRWRRSRRRMDRCERRKRGRNHRADISRENNYKRDMCEKGLGAGEQTANTHDIIVS